MGQKVGFARAMAVERELLCLEEPFSALDLLSADALRGELLELWLGKSIPTQAILLVTHNIEEALLLADRQEKRSEEHTSELQSRSDLVCRLLLEKNKVCSRILG